MALKIRFLKNHMIHLNNGQQIQVPTEPARMREVNTPEGIKTILVPLFNMDALHEVELPDCSLRIPKQRADWDDEFFAAIKHQARVDALRKRSELGEIIRRIKTYVDNNIIEVAEDDEGLMSDESLTLSKAERLVAGIEEREPVVNLKVAHPKPSQIARAAEAVLKGQS